MNRGILGKTLHFDVAFIGFSLNGDQSIPTKKHKGKTKPTTVTGNSMECFVVGLIVIFVTTSEILNSQSLLPEISK